MNNKTNNTQRDCPYCKGEGGPQQAESSIGTAVGARHRRGTMVFWGDDDCRPWWVVEWQEHNGPGGAYWITNAKGVSAVACEEELSFCPSEASLKNLPYND
jgi:hypothetical protein